MRFTKFNINGKDFSYYHAKDSHGSSVTTHYAGTKVISESDFKDRIVEALGTNAAAVRFALSGAIIDRGGKSFPGNIGFSPEFTINNVKFSIVIDKDRKIYTQYLVEDNALSHNEFVSRIHIAAGSVAHFHLCNALRNLPHDHYEKTLEKINSEEIEVLTKKSHETESPSP